MLKINLRSSPNTSKLIQSHKSLHTVNLKAGLGNSILWAQYIEQYNKIYFKARQKIAYLTTYCKPVHSIRVNIKALSNNIIVSSSTTKIDIESEKGLNPDEASACLIFKRKNIGINEPGSPDNDLGYADQPRVQVGEARIVRIMTMTRWKKLKMTPTKKFKPLL